MLGLVVIFGTSCTQVKSQLLKFSLWSTNRIETNNSCSAPIHIWHVTKVCAQVIYYIGFALKEDYDYRANEVGSHVWKHVTSCQHLTSQGNLY